MVGGYRKYKDRFVNMFHIKLIVHKEITEDELNEVIRIKSTQWHYIYEEQLQWIKNNIKDTDIHVLLYLNKNIVAYLNLIDINLEINGVQEKGYGVGNVCAIERGKGFGFRIMQEVNQYILNSKKVGLLFCKEQLLKFYHSLGWKALEPKEYKIKGDNLKVMVFNIKYTNQFLVDYDGAIF